MPPRSGATACSACLTSLCSALLLPLEGVQWLVLVRKLLGTRRAEADPQRVGIQFVYCGPDDHPRPRILLRLDVHRLGLPGWIDREPRLFAGLTHRQRVSGEHDLSRPHVVERLPRERL